MYVVCIYIYVYTYSWDIRHQSYIWHGHFISPLHPIDLLKELEDHTSLGQTTAPQRILPMALELLSKYTYMYIYIYTYLYNYVYIYI